MTVHQIAGDDARTAPTHSRPRGRWRAVSVVTRLCVLTSLLLACTPTAPPAPTSAPTSAPATQAAVAKPTAAPATAPPAAPTSAPAAQQPVAAKPTAAPAAPARVEPKGSIVIALNEEPPMLAAHDATASFSYPVMRNVTEALLNRNPVTNEL